MKVNSNLSYSIQYDSKVLIAAFDEQFRVLSFNKEYKEEFDDLFISNLEPGILLDEALENFPTEKELLIEGLKKSLTHGQFTEVRNVRKNKSTKLFEFTYTALTEANGTTKFSHIARDITHKVKAEKALKEREERYHLLSRSTNDAIYEWNLETNRFWWNDGIFTLFGYSTKDIELTKEWWLENVHPEDKEDLIDKVTTNIKSDISFWSYEYKFRKSDGSYAWVADRSYILYDNKWEPVRIVGAMMDVTERKKAEEALIRREARFSSLLQNSSDIISVINLKGEFIYSTPPTERILGYHEGELKGKKRSSYIHKDDIHVFENVFRSILASPQVITIENRFRHKDGHYVNLESTFNNLLEDASVNGIVINSRDITDRMKVQNELKKSEAILKESQRIAKMGSWEFDVAAKRMIWSEEVFDIFKRKIEDGVPPFSEVLESLTPESRPALENAFRQAIETGTGYNIDYSRVIEGKLQHLNSICNPLKDSNGNIVKLRGIILDISARKETEEKLLESEEWFKTIFNTSRDGFVVELNEKIFFVNEAFVDLFGYYSKDEILGSTITNIIADEDIKHIAEYSQRRLNGEEIPTIYETKGKKKDGHVIDVEISASVFSIRGNKYIIASLRDITERKHAEKQLMEQNEELKKINSELDRFVYSASHDLRAPLVSVLGLTNLIKLSESDDEKIKYLDLVTKSINKLDRFIQEITNHSRNSRVEVKPEAINFQKLIEETFDDLRYLEEAKNAKLNVLVKGSNEFYSDKGRLSVIFSNLISNALRYSAPDVRTPVIDILVSIDPERAIIKISDNGLGIAEHHIDRVFEMFYRASQKNVGSGLGLYIVKESVIKLSGNVKVSSTLGEGTSFEINIPNLNQ